MWLSPGCDGKVCEKRASAFHYFLVPQDAEPRNVVATNNAEGVKKGLQGELQSLVLCIVGTEQKFTRPAHWIFCRTRPVVIAFPGCAASPDGENISVIGNG
ncbi:hypothetical protein ACGVWS_15745 [Enterobacteriaceae bacterium LUAb1]